MLGKENILHTMVVQGALCSVKGYNEPRKTKSGLQYILMHKCSTRPTKHKIYGWSSVLFFFVLLFLNAWPFELLLVHSKFRMELNNLPDTILKLVI